MSAVVYMPQQKAAINQLHSGCILCAPVGTGKSITALGYFFDKVCRGVEWTDGVSRGPLMDPRPLYIITTARKRDTREWNAEFDRFDYDVPLVIDSWNNMHKYTDVHGAFFIFDEQRVVGSGKWTREFYKITSKNMWILLSATPGDTWMDYIPVFLANGFYKSRSQFLNRHAVFKPFSKFPQVMRWDDVSHLETLRRRITVTMTPEKHTERHYEDVYTGYDREKYDQVIKDRWNPFTDEPVKDISEACRLMRQIVNSDGERLEALENLMKEHDKMIVFYNFNFELEALRTLEQLIVIAEWNGQRHQPIPKMDRWLYLVQYSAGAEGWNCVETDTIVFYSQSYSYKLMEQAAGRIDRMNTPFDDLYYYTFRSRASIDVAIARALKGKRTFNEKNFAKMTQLDLPLRTAP